MLPRYQDLMLPALRQLAELGGEARFGQICEAVGQALGLTDAQMNERLPSQSETILENNMRWACTYLLRSGQVVRSDHDLYSLTDLGREYLAEVTDQMNGFSEELQEFGHGKTGEEAVSGDDLHRAISAERMRLQALMLARIQSNSPEFLEKVIVDLLLAFGYGAGSRERVKLLGGTADGGVDGVVEQDALGLETIYFQAKRYKPSSPVPVSAIRDFAGALEAHKATKGIFVTTSRFPSGAASVIASLSRKIVLIDGKELAKLLIEHEVGAKPVEVLKLMRIDESYFPV